MALVAMVRLMSALARLGLAARATGEEDAMTIV